MKDALETVKILAAYDLTKSLRSAAELSGCSHHTVDRLVQARDAGRAPGAVADRGRVTDEWLPKIEEWVEKSKGRIRADVVDAKLAAMGYGVRTAPPAALSRKSRTPTGAGTIASTVPGSPSPGPGFSVISATNRPLTESRRSCSSRGWPGPGSAS